MASSSKTPHDDDIIRDFYGNRFRPRKVVHVNESTVREILESMANGNDSDLDCLTEDEDGEDVPTVNDDENNYIIDQEEIIPDEPEVDDSTQPRDTEYKWENGDGTFNRKSDWMSQEDNFDEEIKSPIVYFKNYYDDDFFGKMAYYTNLYSMQINGRPIDTDGEEIKKLIGMYILMGCLGFPRISNYWNGATRIAAIAGTMSQKRFSKFCTNLHLVDNEADKKEGDRIWKIRPILDSFRARIFKLPFEENLSVDEQIVPFKGQVAFKQYIKNKPTPWGIKNFLLCGQSGLVFDCMVYQGKTTNVDDCQNKEFGLAGTVVLKLANRIPLQKNFRLFFDNYFCSLPLLKQLKQQGILAAGTIRKNRIKKCPIPPEKVLNKLERGASKEYVTKKKEIAVTCWKDNKTVLMASNFIGMGEQDYARRWSKIEKKHVDVLRPEVIRLYNQSMGGVDKIDFLISLYRISIRCRKWTLKMIFHFIDLAVCNAWIEYIKHGTALGIERKKLLDLLGFRNEVASCLIFVNSKPYPKKRGRPSSMEPEATVSKRASNYMRPVKDVRFDGLWHMPCITLESSQRCKRPGCNKKFTRFMCRKCNVPLCIVRDRNCFEMFHTGIAN